MCFAKWIGSTVLAFVLLNGKAQAEVLTFDDITALEEIVPIPPGYGGLDWGDMHIFYKYLAIGSGYYTGATSGDYTAFVYQTGTISSFFGERFDFNGAYLTSAYEDQLSVDVKGYTDGVEMFATTVTLYRAYPSWFDFNFIGIDRLRFTVLTDTDLLLFAIDDFTVNETTNSAPVAIAGAGPDSVEFFEVACDGPAGAFVELDGSHSFDMDNDALEFEWSAAEGIFIDDETAASTFGLFSCGTHQVTLVVYDLDEQGIRRGTSHAATVTVKVFDGYPPLIETFSTDIVALWPNNKAMVPVTIYLETSDHCTAPEDLGVWCEISSSQPDDSNGTGNHIGDVNGGDGFTAPVSVSLDHLGDGLFTAVVELRAERDGKERSGRTYSISVCVIDRVGHGAAANTVVVVPHNQGKKK